MSAVGDAEEKLISEIDTSFKNDVIKEILKSNFVNPKTKVADDAVELIKELAKYLVVESCLRAIRECSTQNRTKVTLEDMESILPQLMLDFP